MFDLAALDVALGLIFVYLILSLICSAVNETVSSVFSWRAKFLREGIANLLDPADHSQGEQVLQRLYAHPLVNGLIRPVRGRRTRYPSYIPSRTFAAALLDLDATGARRSVEESIDAIGSPQVQAALRTLYKNARGNATRFQRSVEEWYDDAMERVSGWYRRRVQLLIWALAIALAVGLNADTIEIAQELWSDRTVRAAVVARAESAAAQAPEADITRVAEDVETLNELDVPLGWSAQEWPDGGFLDWLAMIAMKTLGLLITAAALTLGAPFWFDLLSKVARVRSAGAPPPATGAVRRGEGEEDRTVDEPPDDRSS